MPQVGINESDPESYFNNTDPVIYALDGDDFIRYTGDVGAYIEGGRGNDTIYSGVSAAIVYGGDGNDVIYGGYNPSFRDSFIGDQIHGGRGDDIIHSGGGNDKIYGDEGNDTIYGSNSRATSELAILPSWTAGRATTLSMVALVEGAQFLVVRATT